MSVPRRLLEVSLLIAETLAQVRQDQPDLWRPDWQRLDPSSLVFITKVAQFLEQYEPSQGINRTTENLLQKLLQPPFFKTEVYTQLITCIGQVWQPETTRLVGAILLDVDNQILDVDKEQWIQKITKTSINYRFAFANWKARNADVDLKKRGYYLLHAPAGDDMTDGLMIAFASTLPQHYSEVGQVFVCSNDHTFDALAATLPKYGVTCYRVIQNGHYLYINNHQTGENYKYASHPTSQAEEMVDIIRELLRSQGKIAGEYADLSLIAAAYNSKYSHGISKALRQRGLGSKLRTFCAKHPSTFAIREGKSGQWELAYLDRNPPRPTAAEEMIGIIRELLRSQGKAVGEYAHPSLIATAYNTKYGHGILEGLRRRELGANLRVFIAQHSSDFAIKAGSNGHWEVACRS